MIEVYKTRAGLGPERGILNVYGPSSFERNYQDWIADLVAYDMNHAYAAGRASLVPEVDKWKAIAKRLADAGRLLIQDAEEVASSSSSMDFEIHKHDEAVLKEKKLAETLGKEPQ